jgi:hypothetical protein
VRFPVDVRSTIFWQEAKFRREKHGSNHSNAALHPLDGDWFYYIGGKLLIYHLPKL